MEEYYKCPDNTSQLHYSIGWFGYNTFAGSCEYFNICDTLSINGKTSIPKNFVGYQNPRTGNAYIGCIYYSDIGNREYPMRKLLKQLDSTVLYRYTMFVSLSNISDYAIKDIGIYISKNQLSFDHLFADTIIPTFVNTNNYISDTMGWVKIHGTFKAIGNENYLTIGNFYINRPTNYIQVNNSNNPGSYYYIDDVALYPVDAPIASAQTINDTSICLGNAINIGLTQIESQYKAEYEWFWYKAGHPKDTLSTEEFPVFQPDSTITYVLKLTDFKYDVTFDTVTVTVVDCKTPTMLKVFPNPTNDNINFEFNSTIPENISIEIYNVIGQKIKGLHYLSNLEANFLEINLQTQANGIYFYRVLLGSEILFNGKLIKI